MSAGGGGAVGFVGLGMMGWPMARNLVRAGFVLTVRDADAGRQAAFVEEHACAGAASPQAFFGTPVLVTMLPDDRAVREAVVAWDGGIAARLPDGAVVVDMSSSNPTGTRALADEIAAHGVAVVDAPVSGGVSRAEDGTLTLMIGADDNAAVEQARPVLEVLGGRLFRTGPLGSGHAMKALNNFVGGTTYAITAEALAIGSRLGLDPAVMVEVMNVSTGRSFNTEVVFKDHVVPGAYATGFSLGLLAKDIANAARIAEDAGVDGPFCRLSRDRWAEAVAGLGGSADHSAAHKQWWAGTPEPSPERAGSQG